MATTTSIFLDAPTLSLSIGVYSDIALLTPAPDGWYSDSIVTRRQVSGVLAAAVPCATCDIQPFSSSLLSTSSSGAACALTIDGTYYYSYVSGTIGDVTVGDYVYSNDTTGIPLADGWYSTPTTTPLCPDTYHVVSGIITEIINCCA